MGLFGMGKKREVLDLGERYRKQQEHEEKIKQDAVKKQTPSKYANSISSDSLNYYAKKMVDEDSKKEVPVDEDSDSPEEKKRKFAKRLVDMTDRIEELSNQIYHLQQRIDVLEQKLKVGVSG